MPRKNGRLDGLAGSMVEYVNINPNGFKDYFIYVKDHLVVDLSGWQIVKAVEIKQELDKAEDNSEFFSVGNKEERQYIRFVLLKYTS